MNTSPPISRSKPVWNGIIDDSTEKIRACKPEDLSQLFFSIITNMTKELNHYRGPVDLIPQLFHQPTVSIRDPDRVRDIVAVFLEDVRRHGQFSKEFRLSDGSRASVEFITDSECQKKKYYYENSQQEIDRVVESWDAPTPRSRSDRLCTLPWVWNIIKIYKPDLYKVMKMRHKISCISYIAYMACPSCSKKQSIGAFVNVAIKQPIGDELYSVFDWVLSIQERDLNKPYKKCSKTAQWLCSVWIHLLLLRA